MIYAFSEFELDEDRFELRRGGRAVPLQPKVLALLLHLVRHRARAVPKRELLEAVWPGVTVTGSSLARAVSLARAAIGDRGDPPQRIVTVARRGYRFEGAVEEASAAAAPASDAARYVGRATLLRQLETRMDAALAGGGGCILFLAGEAGIGKTRTAEWLLERARRQGARVAAAFGFDDGAAPYGSWLRALRTLAGEAEELPAFGRGAPAAGPEARRSEDAERYASFEAVRALLEAAGGRAPVALLFDDLHAASAESIALLEFVAATVARLPFAVVATCREDEAGVSPLRARALERLLRSTALERWPLASLDAGELSEFVAARLGRDGEPELLRALERRTGGNPLWMGECLRSLEARGLLEKARRADEWEALLPQGIRHLLVPKLARISAEAREVLGVAAALGVEVSEHALAATVAGGAQLDAACAEAFEAGLLLPASALGQSVRFPHMLVRDALYDELAPAGPKRQALHARISAALEARGGASSFERAHHACAGVPVVPPARAADLAEEAAHQALRDRDFEGAAAWSERALAQLARAPRPDFAREVALRLALGEAQTRAFGLELARASHREAAALARSIGRGDLFAEAALAFAHRPESSGSASAEAIGLLEDARACALAGDEALGVRLLSRLAVELRYDAPARSGALMEEAAAAARRLGDPAVLAQTLDDFSFVRFSPADTEGWVALNAEVVRTAAACGDLELVLSGQRGVATGWLELGARERFAREARAVARTSEALRTPYARWVAAALRTTGSLLAGDLAAAEEHAAGALALGDHIDSREVGVELGAQLVYLRYEQGRAGEVEPAARLQVEQFAANAGWRAALALIQLAAGERARAREGVARLAANRFADVARDRGYLPAFALAARVAYATGDEEAAACIEEGLAPFARLHVVVGGGVLYFGSVAHALGCAAATRSRSDEAIAHFEAALAAERAAGARLWAARSGIALARALLARGGADVRRRAAGLVREALRAARAGGWVEVEREGRELEAALWTPRAPSARGPSHTARGPGAR